AQADPRIYETVRILGHTAGSYWFNGQQWRNDELSAGGNGKRIGEYRVRLAVPLSKSPATGTTLSTIPLAGRNEPPAPASTHAATATRSELEYSQQYPGFEPIELLSDTPATVISASDPWSMRVTTSPLKLPERLPAGTMLYFACQMKDFEG